MKNIFTKILSLVLVIAVITAIALTVTSCGKTQQNAPAPSDSSSAPSSDSSSDTQSELKFKCEITKGDGTTETREYAYTDGQTVGEVMLDAGDIAGEESSYGLYVKTVLGEKHDYDEDGSYWSFYIDGEYAMTGVDATKIEKDVTYALKAEKGQ